MPPPKVARCVVSPPSDPNLVECVEILADHVLSGNADWSLIHLLLDRLSYLDLDEMPPKARKVLAGIKNIVNSTECREISNDLLYACYTAKKRAEEWNPLANIPPEETKELEIYPRDTIIRAVAKSLGVIVITSTT